MENITQNDWFFFNIYFMVNKPISCVLFFYELASALHRWVDKYSCYRWSLDVAINKPFLYNTLNLKYGVLSESKVIWLELR